MLLEHGLREGDEEWKSFSPRMVSAKLAMAESKYLHLVGVYAPTFHAPEQEKIEKIDDLQAVIDGVSVRDLG